MHATTPRPHDTTCPRCGGPKVAGLWLCTPCFVAEPRCCQRCRIVDVLLGGLCATCQADELDADTDPDTPIPFVLTPQALRAMEVLA